MVSASPAPAARLAAVLDGWKTRHVEPVDGRFYLLGSPLHDSARAPPAKNHLERRQYPVVPL
jgi:hypothetical protein